MTANKLTTAIAAGAILLTACQTKDPVYETDHPEHGKIILTTDWTERGSGVEIPASYTVRVGEYSTTLSGTTNTIDHLFAPGTYRTYVYNTPQDVTVSGITVTVAAVDAYISSAPGWFFSSVLDAKVEADTDHDLTAVMQQQMREITFTVTPSGGTPDKIESITGVLGGVAGAMDMDNGKRSSASSVAMNFTKGTDGEWTATIRLLGITGDEQPLTTTVKFIGGHPGDLTDTTDIHDKINDSFDDNGAPTTPGGDGSQPDIDLGTEIVETPTETGFTATIKPWEKVMGTGTAD